MTWTGTAPFQAGGSCGAGCWAAGASDVLMASAVMLVAGRYLASSGALVGAHGAPLRKVALSLGAGSGAAGYFVVRRLRGNATKCVLPQALPGLDAEGVLALGSSAEETHRAVLLAETCHQASQHFVNTVSSGL